MTRREELPLTISHRDFSTLDGISPFGLVVQTLRINCLPPLEAYSTMSIRLTYGEDWSQRLCLSDRLKNSLLARFPEANILSPMWSLKRWQAFGNGEIHWQPILRACPECLKSGYHSMLFQLPWVNRCPWHGASLMTDCASCSKPLWKNIKRESPPLLCDCGHDPICPDVILHETGQLIERRRLSLKRYMYWACASRKRRDIFGLDDDLTEWDVLGMRLPGMRQPWHKPRATRQTFIAKDSNVRHCAPLSSIKQRDDLARIALGTAQTRDFFLEIPLSVEKALQRVSASIASTFPADAFTERERACLGIPGSTSSADRHSRMAIVLLAAYRVGDRAFFDGRILPRPVQIVLQQICIALANVRNEPTRVDGYLAAYERILSRGYAGAAHHILTKLVSPGGRSTAAFWRPVAMIRRRKLKSRLTIVWLRVRSAAADGV